MVRPIRTLQEGAQRIGAGDLEQQIDVRTGDELEALAEPVQPHDRAAARVVRRASSARSRSAPPSCSETLEQQTATAEILRVISSSTDRHAAGVRGDRAERPEAVRGRGDRVALPRRRPGARRCDRDCDPAHAEQWKALPVPADRGVHARAGDPRSRWSTSRCERHPDDVAARTAGTSSRAATARSRSCRCCAATRRSARSAWCGATRAADREADRAAAHLRRPGGDRDRERAPVQRDQGGARAADRDRRGAERDQQLDRPTCSRCSTRSSRAASACCDAATCRVVLRWRAQRPRRLRAYGPSAG